MIEPILKPKDKKQKRKPKNHSIRNKRRTKRGMVLDLDKWARNEIVIIRDENICQWCDKHYGDWYVAADGVKRCVVIQWAHVHSREYYITRWEPDNSLALCDECHVRFDRNKVLGFDWFRKKYPERWDRITAALQGYCKTSDAWVCGLWLEHCGGARG